MSAPVMVVAALPDSLVNFRGELLRRIVATGRRVVAVAAREDALCGLSGGDVSDRLRAMGVEFRSVSLDRTGLDPRRDFGTVRELTTLMREVRPELVFGYTIKAALYGSLAARRAGVPRTVSMFTGLGAGLGGQEGGPKAAVVRSLARHALRDNQTVIFQNPDDLDLLVTQRIVRAGQAALVDGSGVDLAQFPFVHVPAPPHVFLMVSRILPEKGVAEFAASAAAVRSVHPEARFVHFGPADGHRPMPDAFPGRSSVEWRGATVDVRPALAGCTVYVLPSYREGTPRTVLEAMATGRAVVTTDAPGCRETVVPEETGLLVPPSDAEALTRALCRFVEEPGMAARMGPAGRALAERKYDVHRVNDRMMELLGLVPSGAGVPSPVEP